MNAMATRLSAGGTFSPTRRFLRPLPNNIILIAVQGREVKDKGQQQRRRRRRKPPNPLIRHVPPRNPEPEAPRRIHLSPGITRKDAAGGEGDETQAAARQKRGQPRPEEEALLRIDTDAIGDEEVGEGREALV